MIISPFFHVVLSYFLLYLQSITSKGVINMYLKYSLGFFIASLVQAGVITFTERFNISILEANLSLVQLIIHILVGQAAGFLFLLAMQRFKYIGDINYFTLGSIFGIIVWLLVIPFVSYTGQISPPWEQGMATVLSSIAAFLAYGIISAYTIIKYAYSDRETIIQ